MLALTVYRPWTWAICHPSPKAKGLENRDWTPSTARIGKYFAIHAGGTYDDAAIESCTRILGEPPPADAACPRGIVAVARYDGYLSHSDDPWFAGPFGWVLADVRVLTAPVACRGDRYLWEVPEHIEGLVRLRIPRAAGALR